MITHEKHMISLPKGLLDKVREKLEAKAGEFKKPKHSPLISELLIKWLKRGK